MTEGATRGSRLVAIAILTIFAILAGCAGHGESTDKVAHIDAQHDKECGWLVYLGFSQMSPHAVKDPALHHALEVAQAGNKTVTVRWDGDPGGPCAGDGVVVEVTSVAE